MLDGNGQVILQEDGLPVIQEKADQEGQPGESEEGQEEQPGESGESPSEQPKNRPAVLTAETAAKAMARSRRLRKRKNRLFLNGGTAAAAVTPEQQVPEEPAQTNEELVAAQQIMELPVIKKDFRFWTVARKYAFAKDGLEIMEGMEEDARAVGKLEKDGVCYILKEEENGWLYVESGRVRGFVKAEQVLTGEAGQKLLEKYQKEAREKAEKDGTVYAGISGTAGKRKN